MIKKKLFKSTKTFLTAVAVSAIGMTTLVNPAVANADVIINDGKWSTTNGADFTGLDSNEAGWWYIENGIVNFDYTGIKPNDFGWWKIDGGKVNFDFTGLASNEYGWWYLENGKVNFDYTGIKPNEYGWWKVTNGAVDFTYNGLASNEYGWWYLENGKVNFDYTGVCANEAGIWYVEDGQIKFNHNGVAEYNGTYYDVENSKLIGAKEDKSDNTEVKEDKNNNNTSEKAPDKVTETGYYKMGDPIFGTENREPTEKHYEILKEIGVTKEMPDLDKFKVIAKYVHEHQTTSIECLLNACNLESYRCFTYFYELPEYAIFYVYKVKIDGVWHYTLDEGKVACMSGWSYDFSCPFPQWDEFLGMTADEIRTLYKPYIIYEGETYTGNFGE